MKQKSFQIGISETSLATIYDKYIEGVAGITHEQKESLRGCFYSGASAVLHVFDQLTANALAADEVVQQLLDQGLGEQDPRVMEANMSLDDAAEQVQEAMSTMMGEVCECFGVANNSYVCHSMSGVDVRLVSDGDGDRVQVDNTFDLANWKPEKGDS